MNQYKMHLVNKIFNNETIRTVWDKKQEKLNLLSHAKYKQDYTKWEHDNM